MPSGVRRPAFMAQADGPGFVRIFGFVALHLALALVMKRVHPVAGIHALGTFIYGLWLCCGRNRPLPLAQWAGYTAGAEALWRMCGAYIPWEFAELSISLICLISLVRAGNFGEFWLPLLYLVLLAPASFLTFLLLPFGEARSQVSFYISPAAALALCAMRFSRLRLTPAGLQRIGVAVIAPIAGMGAVALSRIATTEAQFGNSSNVVASGGYGPNQVSAMLSLGALLVVFLYLGVNRSLWMRGGFVVLGLWLQAQSAMTFSRTGLYLFGAAFVVATPFLVQAKGKALRFLLLLIFLIATTCAIAPMLDSFTGGQLIHRFEDSDLTGRDTIAEAELRMWLQKPVLGNGVGMSMYNRSAMTHAEAPAAHTEYTRLLAEHGLLGAAAMAILLVMTAQAFLKAPGPWAKAVVAALAVWSFLFMAVASMRLVAPAFLLGLVHARFGADHPTAITGMVKARPVKPPAWQRTFPRTTGAGNPQR
jgi:O-antigen ligase